MVTATKSRIQSPPRCYARIVKEKSTLRRLIVMGNSVMRAELDAPGEPTDVLSSAEKSIYEIAEGSIEKGFVTLDWSSSPRAPRWGRPRS